MQRTLKNAVQRLCIGEEPPSSVCMLSLSCIPLKITYRSRPTGEIPSSYAENEKRRIADDGKLTALTDDNKQERDQAVQEAMGELRSELQNPGADAAEVATRHAEEQLALEAKPTLSTKRNSKLLLRRLEKRLGKRRHPQRPLYRA